MKEIKNYALPGTKNCESNCDREVIVTRKETMIICHYCERIIRIVPK